MSCQCQMENTTRTTASEMKNEKNYKRRRWRRRREKCHIRMSVIDVSHNSGKCRIYRRLNIIEFSLPFHSFGSVAHLPSSRLMTNSNICILCGNFEAWLLEIFNATTLHYAVDVRQPRRRSTTMSSPDINIGFYMYFGFCVCVVVAVCRICVNQTLLAGKRMAPLCHALPCVINSRDLFAVAAVDVLCVLHQLYLATKCSPCCRPHGAIAMQV